MRRHTFLYVAVSVFLVSLISSCLGDEGDMVSVGNQPGVVVKNATETKVMLRDIEIYADNFGGGVDNGDCLILKYKIDFGLLANSDSGRRSGLYKAEILQTDTVHNEPLLAELELDTVSVLPGEQIISSLQQRYAIINNQFFLYSVHKEDSLKRRLHNLFELSYNPEQEPRQEENRAIYDLYLRVVKAKDGEVVSEPEKIFVNAFNISELLAKSNDSVFFRVKYVSNFNKDTTAVANWSASSVFRYPPVIVRDERP